jgi:hypothetical protein
VAFLTIGGVIGVADYDRIRNAPKVELAAALRKDGISLSGYFVAETDLRIYLGRAGIGARLIEIPRDNVANRGARAGARLSEAAYLIALAAAQRAVLVSGDSDLLAIDAAGLPIYAASDFLSVVDQRE